MKIKIFSAYELGENPAAAADKITNRIDSWQKDHPSILIKDADTHTQTCVVGQQKFFFITTTVKYK